VNDIAMTNEVVKSDLITRESNLTELDFQVLAYLIFGEEKRGEKQRLYISG
jgi:hypothetical protein